MYVDEVFCKPWMAVVEVRHRSMFIFILKGQLMLLHGDIPMKLISAKWLVGTIRNSHMSISAGRGISWRYLGEDKFKLLDSFVAFIPATMAYWTCIRVAKERGWRTSPGEILLPTQLLSSWLYNACSLLGIMWDKRISTLLSPLRGPSTSFFHRPTLCLFLVSFLSGLWWISQAFFPKSEYALSSGPSPSI